jgi:hypothetical protein
MKTEQTNILLLFIAGGGDSCLQSMWQLFHFVMHPR